MASDSSIEMDEEARDAFLGTGGTGVLSLSTADDEPPHGIPVSYGYDQTESTFYFRLATGADSAKGHLDGRPVVFVTYGDDDDRWKSVVARGHLVDVRDEDIATDALDGLDHVDIPLIDIFHAPTREVEFEFHRLAPDELTARTESRSPRE